MLNAVTTPPGYAVLAGGEPSHIIGRDARNGWYPRGGEAATPVSLPR